MTITTVSSRQFNQDVSKIKHAALKGPVFITDRGRPAHVLLAIRDYQKLTKKEKNIIDFLAMPKASADIDFKAPKLKKDLYHRAELD